jgi:hypothetical protein
MQSEKRVDICLIQLENQNLVPFELRSKFEEQQLEGICDPDFHLPLEDVENIFVLKS